jgi:ABC-type glycerol-3-phosphate transport system substrate-binding protein
MNIFNSILAAVAAAGLLAGCGKSGSGSQISTATNGFGGYVKSLGEAQKTADKTIDVTSINQEIQLFNVQEGRNPKTLQELVPNFMAKIPDAPNGYKIIYDATKGEVKVVQQP